MTIRFVSRALLIFGLLIAASSYPTADQQPNPVTDAICVTRTNGQVRFISGAEGCRGNEIRLPLSSLIGPAGATGATGATGAAGAKGDAGAAGAAGQAGPAGAAGAQGETGATGATGPQGAIGPGGAAAAVRLATVGECPTGGIVVSDDTSSVPVCSGARGATGATGAEGPAGPMGIAPIDENAIVTVTNLRVSISNYAPFRPTGVSRIGIDIPVQFLDIGGDPHLVQGNPAFPAFRVMLGTDAPINNLRTEWHNLVNNGQLVEHNVTVFLDYFEGGKSFTEFVKFEMPDSLITGFSDGSVGPAYLDITPGRITIPQPENIPSSLYSGLDLPVQSSPTFEIKDADHFMGVYQVSGGDHVLSLAEIGIGGDRLPGASFSVSLSDLRVTAVARQPGQLKSGVDLDAFDALRQWALDVVMGMDSRRNLLIKTRAASNGSVLQTLEYQVCIPTKINLVNPVLVQANEGVAPWVFDLRIKATNLVVQ